MEEIYQRFLRNVDYLRITTQQHFDQTTRRYEKTIPMSEITSETQIIENMIENYQIESVLQVGKNMRDYSPFITYPERSFFWVLGRDEDQRFNDTPYMAIAPIRARIRPTTSVYWLEVLKADIPKHIELDPVTKDIPLYTQFNDYSPDNYVKSGELYYKCLIQNGFSLNNIQPPRTSYWVNPWMPATASIWTASVWNLLDIVEYEGGYYQLTNLALINYLTPPNLAPDNWTAIEPYNTLYNAYAVGDIVVLNNELFQAVGEVNSHEILAGRNVIKKDPRNPTLIKHLTQLSWYDVTKKLAPSNVSQSILNDYEETCKWLKSCNKCQISPQGIPRNVDADGNKVNDWAFADFESDASQTNSAWMV